MTTPLPIRASLKDILLLIQTQVVAITGLDISRVIITAKSPDQVLHAGATEDILLRVMGERPDTNQIDGAGRIVNNRLRTVQVVVRTKVALDPTGQDQVHLTDPTLGHFVLEDSVVDALEEFFPLDINGNLLTAVPVRIGPWGLPTPDREDDTWLSSTADLEIVYTRNLDLTKGY
ncbi:MAG: hypothetical protein KGL39_51600 [Patescibacteria group bacterium]|nr:hypothetical protein [Patescibacteria group bacterium]